MVERDEGDRPGGGGTGPVWPDLSASRESSDFRGLFEAIAEASPDLIYVVDREDTVRYVNRSACQFIGKQRHELIGLPRGRLFPTEIAQRQRESLDRACAEGRTLRVEGLVAYPQGAMWQDTYLVPLRDATGTVTAVLGVSRDLTAHHRNEVRLRLSTRILETLNTPSGNTDTVGTILRYIQEATNADAACIRLVEGDRHSCYLALGFPDGHPVGDDHLTVLDERGEPVLDSTGRPELRCFCGAVLQGRADLLGANRTPGGGFVTGGLSALRLASEGAPTARMLDHCLEAGFESLAIVPLGSGGRTTGLLQLCSRRQQAFPGDLIEFLEGIAASIGVALDRMRTEATLRENLANYRLLFDSANDAITVHRIGTEGQPPGPFLEVNDVACRLSGYARAEMLAITPWALIAPDEVSVALDSLKKTVEKGHSVFELRVVRKDGSRFPAELSAHLIELKGRTHMLSVIRDITERREIENARRRLQQQIAHGRKMEAAGLLAGGIAQDFNNILTTILGQACVLAADAQPGSVVGQAARAIEKAAERAASLTRQLLGFARRGKQQNVSLDLDEAIEEAIQGVCKGFDPTIRILHRRAARSTLVMGDPSQIAQVITNLATNARDAMPDGGELVFETSVVDDLPAETLCDPTAPGGRFARLTVSDTGIGFPKEHAERIFEPFFTTKEPGKALGMGLAMVYGIVKNHGGSVAARSEIGMGSRFEVYLPLIERAATDGPEIDAIVEGSGYVMLVDDEESILTTGRIILERAGYEVATFDRAEDAIAHFGCNPARVSVVILDYMMPGMDGLECLRALRSIDPGVRAIGSTAYGREGAMEQLLAEGAAAIIEKPYNLRRFTRVVADVVGGDIRVRTKRPGD